MFGVLSLELVALWVQELLPFLPTPLTIPLAVLLMVVDHVVVLCLYLSWLLL